MEEKINGPVADEGSSPARLLPSHDWVLEKSGQRSTPFLSTFLTPGETRVAGSIHHAMSADNPPRSRTCKSNLQKIREICAALSARKCTINPASSTIAGLKQRSSIPYCPPVERVGKKHVEEDLGHALTARRYGIRTRDITLLPIGGGARLERMPDRPIHEFWVAIAGPAVNVLTAIALLVWLVTTDSHAPLTEMGIAEGSFLERLMAVNLFLVAFNMIPAFPMDGGRVLRALLATRLEYTRATSIAAGLGSGIALVFGLIGFFTNTFLIFIALFVWIGAQQESSMAQMRSSLGGIPVSRAMLTDFRSLHPTDPISRAAEMVIPGFQADFPARAADALTHGHAHANTHIYGKSRHPVDQRLGGYQLPRGARQGLRPGGLPAGWTGLRDLRSQSCG